MEMIARGDVVIAAQKGAMTGKPRPVLVIQTDVANTHHDSITACLISTELRGAGLVRLAISPNSDNGLTEPSEIQIDLIYTFRRENIDQRAGRLAADDMQRVDEALRRWLDL